MISILSPGYIAFQVLLHAKGTLGRTPPCSTCFPCDHDFFPARVRDHFVDSGTFIFRGKILRGRERQVVNVAGVERSSAAALLGKVVD